MYDFYGALKAFFLEVGINAFWAEVNTVAILIAGLLVAAYAFYFAVSFTARGVVAHLAKRTKTLWDDMIVKNKVIRYLSHLVPGVIIYWGVSQLFPSAGYFKFIEITRVTTSVYMVVMVMVAINAFFNAVHDIYNTYPISKDRPIKTYIQLVKIFFFFIGGIVAISILLRKDPISLILGLGAMSAVLMLIFKDTILGLVASVQASANHLVKPGDWIEMPDRGVDGIVQEITLNTVKVQNWNRTISSFPTYALISESFQNWQGMEESNGRQIARCVYIDATSIHFCSSEELGEMRRIPFVRDIIAADEGAAGEEAARRYTNLGVFRQYVNAYLSSRTDIVRDAVFLMRMREPSAQGVPMQVFCYSAKKSLQEYEEVQSSILEHIYSAMHAFNLRPAQRVTNSRE